MQDTIHHKQLRENLVMLLRTKGITSEKVLEAIGKTPRHLFVSEKQNAREIYSDVAAEIGKGQTISQPYTVAFQTQLLDIKAGDKILEIGTGSGYQAVVLFHMGAEVYTIERHESLHREVKKKLTYLGYTGLHVFYGDGNDGIPEYAPYDKILVTAAAPAIPDALITQLKMGGILIVPVDGSVQKMLRITKLSDTHNKVEDFGQFRFVPMLPGTEKE